MPILPQAFWYKVDGKLKQVYFEEAKIPRKFVLLKLQALIGMLRCGCIVEEKRDALLKHLQRTRNYVGDSASDESQQGHSTAKEKIYGNFFAIFIERTHFDKVTFFRMVSTSAWWPV